VIEICVSGHEYDRSKLRSYASAGIHGRIDRAVEFQSGDSISAVPIHVGKIPTYQPLIPVNGVRPSGFAIGGALGLLEADRKPLTQSFERFLDLGFQALGVA